MMGPLETIVTIREQKVRVIIDRSADGRVYHLRAECGSSDCERTVTIGPSECAGPEDYDEVMFQRDIDAARRGVASEAEWKARIRRIAENIK